MRRLVALIGLVVTPLLVVGCGDGGEDADANAPAITVNTTKIRTRQVVDELRTIAANPKLAAYYAEDDYKLVPRKDTIDPDIAGSWITSLAYQVFMDDEFEKRGLEIDPARHDTAVDKAGQIFGGAKIFAAFPQQFQDLVVRRQERIEALSAALPKAPDPTEAELRDLYTQVQKQCPTGKLVSQTWNPTKAEADAIVAEVGDGADFATVARERSQDEVTNTRGGLFTCVGAPQYNGLPEETRTAIEALPMGGVTEPIAGQGGYFVEHVQPMTYESILPLLEIEFRRKQFTPLAGFITQQLREAKPLAIEKRFGRIVRTPGNVAIAPPGRAIDLSD